MGGYEDVSLTPEACLQRSCSGWLQFMGEAEACCVCRIIEVAKLAESRMDAEKAPGCGTCKDNRLLVEKAWQIIANEYYDPKERFSQAAWARQLLQAFQVARVTSTARAGELYSDGQSTLAISTNDELWTESCVANLLVWREQTGLL